MRVHTTSRAVPVIAVILLLSTPRPASSQSKDPWFGTWSLNFAKSSQTADGPRYKRVTSTIAPSMEGIPDGIKVIYDMVGPRGGVTHWEWTGRFDGKDYLVQGVDTLMTNAYTRLDDNSYEIVVKIEGIVAAKSRVTVSPDGNTLSAVTEESSAGRSTTSVYERVRS